MNLYLTATIALLTIILVLETLPLLTLSAPVAAAVFAPPAAVVNEAFSARFSREDFPRHELDEIDMEFPRRVGSVGRLGLPLDPTCWPGVLATDDRTPAVFRFSRFTFDCEGNVDHAEYSDGNGCSVWVINEES